MIDITTIPADELLHDLAESALDSMICRQALAIGLAEYGDGKSVQYRLDVNLEIMRRIRQEFKRRRNRD